MTDLEPSDRRGYRPRATRILPTPVRPSPVAHDAAGLLREWLRLRMIVGRLLRPPERAGAPCATNEEHLDG
jgi:hypothetical protein